MHEFDLRLPHSNLGFMSFKKNASDQFISCHELFSLSIHVLYLLHVDLLLCHDFWHSFYLLHCTARNCILICIFAMMFLPRCFVSSLLLLMFKELLPNLLYSHPFRYFLSTRKMLLIYFFAIIRPPSHIRSLHGESKCLCTASFP